MRAFLKVLLWGFAAFMVLTIGQEWEFFSTSWLGRSTPPPALSDAQKKGAVDAVFVYLKMTSHLYGSQGDPRFAERIAAAPPVTQETLADVAYLRRNGRVQDPVLLRMEALAVDPLGQGALVKTKEFWITRTFGVGSDEELGPARSEIVFAKYRLEPDGPGWRVMAWDFYEPPPGEAGPETSLEPQKTPALESAH